MYKFDKYVPESILYRDIDSHNGIPIVTPYCARLKKKISSDIESSKVCFDSFEIVRTKIKRGRLPRFRYLPLVKIENGKKIIINEGNNAFNSICDLLGTNTKISNKFTLLSKAPGQALDVVLEHEKPLWSKIKDLPPLPESIDPSKIEAGGIYWQLSKGGNRCVVYLGRIRNPAIQNRLQHCYFRFKVAKNVKLIGDNKNLLKTINLFFDYLKNFSDQEVSYYHSALKTSLSNTIPDNIIGKIGNLSFQDISALSDECCTDIAELIQTWIDDQWIQYKIFSETRKLKGKLVKFSGGGEHWSWRRAGAPSWLAYKYQKHS